MDRVFWQVAAYRVAKETQLKQLRMHTPTYVDTYYKYRSQFDWTVGLIYYQLVVNTNCMPSRN